MKKDTAETFSTLLQDRLNALSDLAPTLKHVHWTSSGRILSRFT
jgi:starvation-inducible DNA-binding protein